MGSTVMNWNWHDEGFSTAPRAVEAPTGLRLFRAWGGASSKTGNPARPGLCLSTQRPSTRTEAERLFSAWEWGNSCLWITEFRVAPGTILYLGHVHPGLILDLRLLGPQKGVQVFIENPVRSKIFEAWTSRLVDDLDGRHVVAGSKRTH
jgi:hypothetical protein